MARTKIRSENYQRAISQRLRVAELWFFCTALLLNPFPNKPWFSHVCSRSLLKTLWEKEKLLITSNFSFSHCVFYPFEGLSAIFIKLKVVVCKPFEFGRIYSLSFGKGLNKVFFFKCLKFQVYGFYSDSSINPLV